MHTILKPTDGIITSGWGDNPGMYSAWGIPFHTGTDFRAAIGTPLVAPYNAVARPLTQYVDGEVAGFGHYMRFELGMAAVLFSDLYTAVNFTTNPNEPIFAEEGQIVRVGELYIYVAHLSRFAFNEAQFVQKGQEVMYSGNTGNSTAPHVHVELRFVEWRNGCKGAFNGEGLYE